MRVLLYINLRKKLRVEMILPKRIEVTIGEGELPTSEEAGFLIHRPDSIPTHPKPQAPSWAFPPEAFGKAGYGGHDLQRRVFGLSHPYRGELEEADI
jgi:hypothetical protein